MKKTLLMTLAAMIFLAGQTLGQNTPPPQKAAPPAKQAQVSNKGPFKSEMDRVSYCYGLDFGEFLKRQSLDINVDLFLKGLKDKLGGKKPAMTDEEMRMTMSAFQQKMMQKQREEYQKALEKNKKEGEDFLAANKKKKGVQVTASGLQYKVVKSGTGRSPKEEEMIEVNYEGKLLDGTVFDSSFERGSPGLFMANRLIPGWKEALTMMNPGSEWELAIPSNLAYGERGMPQGGIGPEATLLFRVQLIAIKSNMPPPPSMQQRQPGQ